MKEKCSDCGKEKSTVKDRTGFSVRNKETGAKRPAALCLQCFMAAEKKVRNG